MAESMRVTVIGPSGNVERTVTSPVGGSGGTSTTTAPSKGGGTTTTTTDVSTGQVLRETTASPGVKGTVIGGLTKEQAVNPQDTYAKQAADYLAWATGTYGKVSVPTSQLAAAANVAASGRRMQGVTETGEVVPLTQEQRSAVALTPFFESGKGNYGTLGRTQAESFFQSTGMKAPKIESVADRPAFMQEAQKIWYTPSESTLFKETQLKGQMLFGRKDLEYYKTPKGEVAPVGFEFLPGGLLAPKGAIGSAGPGMFLVGQLAGERPRAQIATFTIGGKEMNVPFYSGLSQTQKTAASDVGLYTKEFLKTSLWVRPAAVTIIAAGGTGLLGGFAGVPYIGAAFSTVGKLATLNVATWKALGSTLTSPSTYAALLGTETSIYGLSQAVKGSEKYVGTTESKAFYSSERFLKGLEIEQRAGQTSLGPISYISSVLPGNFFANPYINPLQNLIATRQLTAQGYTTQEQQWIKQSLTSRQAAEAVSSILVVGALGEMHGQFGIRQQVSKGGTFLGAAPPKAYEKAWQLSYPKIFRAGFVEGAGIEFSQQQFYGAPYKQGNMWDVAAVGVSALMGGTGAALIGSPIAARSILEVAKVSPTRISDIYQTEGAAYLADITEKPADVAADVYTKTFSKMTGRNIPEVVTVQRPEGIFWQLGGKGTPVNVRTPTITPTLSFTSSTTSVGTTPTSAITFTPTTTTTFAPTTTSTFTPTETFTFTPTSTTSTPTIVPTFTPTTTFTLVPTTTPTTTPTSTPTTTTTITPQVQLPPFWLFPMGVELGGRFGSKSLFTGLFGRYTPNLRGLLSGASSRAGQKMFTGLEVRGIGKATNFKIGFNSRKRKKRR